MPRETLLSFEEIEELTRLLVAAGVDSIKLTGGEPLVRRDLPTLVRMLRRIDDGLDLSLTTNGFLLANYASALADAGLDRVTVSCDSLLKHRFEKMTLRDALDGVMDGIAEAARVGLTPVKINTVVMRGFNEDEVEAFARLARDTGYSVRFIEYMPLDAQDEWKESVVVPAAEILDRIAHSFPIEEEPAEGMPATTYRFVDGAPGTIGVIASVTEPFCDSCNRLRLTADGQLRACLFALEETDLRTPLRAGATGVELMDIIRACVSSKWAGHKIGREDFVRPARSMSAIGG
jgi:GTP 3',8-cyclase